METTLSHETPSKVRLTVTATSDEVAPALGRAVKSLANEVKVPGFRKGKVPRKLLETHLGRDALREATLREAVPELLSRAVEGETISPVAPPSVEVTSYDLDQDLIFDATVEVRPEIQLPDLDGLRATKPSIEPTEDEVDEQLARLRDRFANLETIGRPARTGDYALIDITGSLHDQRIEELSGTDELYQIGSGFPVVELDNELGAKTAGDILKFNATLPDNVGGEFAGREVTFTVLVKEIREKNLPALDDEFAKTASEYDTLAELRDDIAGRVRQAKDANAETEVRQQILQAVLDEVEVDPPEALVEEEFSYRAQRLSEQLQLAGMTLDDYIARTDATEQQIESDLRTQAIRNVRAQLILEEIGRGQGLKVTEDELRSEIGQHAAAMRADAKDLTEELTKTGRILALAGDIIRRKALDFLVERADITSEASAGDEPDNAPAATD
ncbi:MAG TPA: trigger factor [Actinomycetota bacterium]